MRDMMPIVFLALFAAFAIVPLMLFDL